jgi:polyphenol oxidase
MIRRTSASSSPAGHQQFELAGDVAARLAGAGVGTVAIPGQDTLAEEERFFSYRRATLAGEDGYGRQISLIGIGAWPCVNC